MNIPLECTPKQANLLAEYLRDEHTFDHDMAAINWYERRGLTYEEYVELDRLKHTIVMQLRAAK